MPEITEKTEKHGILVSGLIMAKNEFAREKGTKYSVDLAIAGQREMLSISVEPEEYNKLKVMDPFKSMATYNLFKGRIYWNKVR